MDLHSLDENQEALAIRPPCGTEAEAKLVWLLPGLKNEFQKGGKTVKTGTKFILETWQLVGRRPNLANPALGGALCRDHAHYHAFTPRISEMAVGFILLSIIAPTCTCAIIFSPL